MMPAQPFGDTGPTPPSGSNIPQVWTPAKWSIQVPPIIFGAAAIFYPVLYLTGHGNEQLFLLGTGFFLLMFLCSLVGLLRPRSITTTAEGLTLTKWYGSRFILWNRIEKMTYRPSRDYALFNSSKAYLRVPGRVWMDLSLYSNQDEEAIGSMMIERSGLKQHPRKELTFVQPEALVGKGSKV